MAPSGEGLVSSNTFDFLVMYFCGWFLANSGIGVAFSGSGVI
jgi:hypothetical protein